MDRGGYLNGYGNVNDWSYPAQITNNQLQSSSMEIGGEVGEAVKREMQALIQPLVEEMQKAIQNASPMLVEVFAKGMQAVIPQLVAAVQKGVLDSLPSLVEDQMKKMAPTIPPTCQCLIQPSGSRSLLDLGESRASRPLHLHIEGQLPKKLFTGKKLLDQGPILQVALRNEFGIVKDCTESSAKIKIVVLPGDLETEDRGHLTGKKFTEHILKERDGKRPLLVGICELKLQEGAAWIGEFMFTDNSSWHRSGKFRLGVISPGETIREAISEAFEVRERRGESYQKKETPTSNDPVWCLYHISKNGQTHNRLKVEGINNVQDLVQLYEHNRRKLKEILKVSDRILQEIVDHATRLKKITNWNDLKADAYGGNDAPSLAYENQIGPSSVYGTSSQMVLPTGTIDPAIIAPNMQLPNGTTAIPGESEVQLMFNYSTADTMLPTPVNYDGHEWSCPDVTHSWFVCDSNEFRRKFSRKWCVLRAVKWVILLRGIETVACRPQKKQKISRNLAE